MPDVLTPMVALVLYLLLFAPELSIGKKVFLWVCLFFFLFSHNSHVAMAGLFLVGMLLFSLIRRKTLAPGFHYVLGGIALVIGSCILFGSWYNGRHGMPAVYSPAAHVFLTGRLCENRLLGDYLDKHCAERDYPLCVYKNELPDIPGNFIWPEYNIAGRLNTNMAVADSMLAPMVGDLLSDPEYLGRYIRSCVVSTIVQFFQVTTNSGLVSYPVGTSPQVIIAQRLRWESSSYITSYQAFGDWDLKLVDRVVHVAFFFSLFVLIWTYAGWRKASELSTVILIVLVWVVLNAAVTSSLANVYDRLQSRVAWMVVFAACLALLNTRWGRRLLGRPEFVVDQAQGRTDGPVG
jgi:hypothetical protein